MKPSEKKIMLRYILPILLAFSSNASDNGGVTGKVSSPTACSKSVMVWLALDEADYQKRLLLMHTEVPVGGKFKFYLKPGNYEVRATDEKGCEFSKKVTVASGVVDVPVRMKK